MKILQYTIFTLFLGVLTITAQTNGSKNTIAKNSPDMAGKKTEAAVEPAGDEEGSTAPISVRSFLGRAGVDSQQNTALSLNDAIRKALENNNEIEIAKQNVKIAESTLRSRLGFYDPIFTIAPGYSDDVQPVTSTFGGGGSSGTTSTKQLVLNSDVTHNIKPGGGNYSVFFNNNRVKTSATFSQFTPTYNTDLGITYNQPLFRNFSIDSTRQQIRIQRKRVAQSDADFRARTIDIIRQVQTSYWDLVFALRDQQNRVENLDLSRENLRQVRVKIKAGSVAPLAEAEVLTELANRETDVINAAQLVANAENALKQLILRDPNSPEWSAQITPSDRPSFGEDKIDLDAVVKDAITNRPELSRLRIEREVSDINIQYFRNQLKPRIDLNASYFLAGLAGTPTGSLDAVTLPLIGGDPLTDPDAFLLQQLRILNPGIVVPNVVFPSSVNPRFTGGYAKSLRNLFSTDFRTINVGVTISFPLKNQTAKANLATAQAERTQLEASTRSREQEVIVEVRNAVQAVEAARQRIFSAREALKNAQIQLDGQRTLFQLGRSDTFLLFQRENQLAAARNALIRAETDYNKALADLQRATSTTLTMNNIQIDTPTR